MERNLREEKMTPAQREIHRKQSEAAADLFFEGAEWRDEGSPHGPRLHITDEQYEYLLREMADAFAEREKDTQAFRDTMDKNLAELLRLRRTPYGAAAESLPGETPESPLSAEAYYDLFNNKVIRFRGFVETPSPGTEQIVVAYRDVQQTEIENAPDFILRVDGMVKEDGKGSADVQYYEARLSVRSRAGSTPMALGRIQFSGELMELNAENKELIGDMFFASARSLIERANKTYGGYKNTGFWVEVRDTGADALVRSLTELAKQELARQKGG